jgi:hypothetical protein
MLFEAGAYLSPTLIAVLTTQKSNSLTKTHRIMLRKEIIFIYETVSKDSYFMVALYYCDVGTELLNNV